MDLFMITAAKWWIT